MKEHGIIFNAEMVRAILDGRKTQTRRVMNNQPCTLSGETISVQQDDFNFRWVGDLHNDTSGWFTCPLGKVGDRLWVRETWSVVSHEFDDDGLMIDYVPDRPTKDVREMPYGHGYYTGHVIYSADGDFTWGDDDGCIDGRSCWKPSIHMPRWASRITLEITDVRVERLQSISEADAKAEGFDNSQSDATNSIGWFEKPIRAFRRIWENIYGDGGWNNNHWVWVIEFKKVE
ncbi:hypothetical protein [Proteus mirabilis]|uniref:hypothetical protein n=1 Tax=Proteus mirabilis TaxID=584 RepID=UPI00131639A2|nr:hypothetical protein [Proteus mirabilis]QHA71131.1 hypothetical protein GO498_12465 [Proteus mirabilis]